MAGGSEPPSTPSSARYSPRLVFSRQFTAQTSRETGPAAHQSADAANQEITAKFGSLAQAKAYSLPEEGGREHIGPSRVRGLVQTQSTCDLEIRLVRPRDGGFLSREPLGVFGANRFGPVVGAAPIGHGRGPRRLEHACVFDRELELQELARMFRVPDSWRDLILLGVPFESLFGGCVIDHPISFDDVQSRCVRSAIPVDHGPRSDLDPYRVDDQHIAFIVPHRIPIPGRRHLRRMRLVQAGLTDLMIVIIEARDLVRLLHQLRCPTRKGERDASWPTLGARSGIADAL